MSLNFNVGSFGSNLAGGSSSPNYGSAITNFNYGVNNAGLQTPGATQQAASGVSTNANVQGINQIQLPSWLSTNPNQNISELMSTYGNIPNAFDPTNQVKAINSSIGYNTAAGTQAANSAATQYSNSAAQSGGSQAAAGTVKAQNLMPVLNSNAQLQIQAANTAAQDYQAGAALSAQVASTIGQLRNSYLSTLTQYATGQQQLQLQKYQAQQQVAGQQSQIAEQYAQQRANLFTSEQSLANQSQGQQIAAAQSLMGAQGPTGSWVTDNSGNVTQGQQAYNNYQTWAKNKQNASNYLGSMV